MQAIRYARLYWIAALGVAVALIYWPSTIFLYGKWTDKGELTYTHGALILLICIALVVRSRRELAAASARASPAGAVALALAIIAWLVAFRASMEGLEVPLQPLIFWLAVLTAFGWGVARLLLFPVGYLYFAEPIWYGGPLQHLTVRVMRVALTVTGPPAVIVGDVIHIPNGTFLIEEGCSGLHFMIVGLAVAALYGEQQRDPWPLRLRQLAAMAGLALLANWIRVYTVIEAGYLTDMQSYLVRVSHYGFGWCVFAVALLIFFWLAPRLGRQSPAAEAKPGPPRPEPARPLRRHGELVAVLGALAVLILVPLLHSLVRRTHAPPALADPAASLSPQPPWHPVPVDVRSAWLPVFAGADELKRGAFGNADDATVEVLGVAYRAQRQGAELVGETSSVIGDRLEVRTEELIPSRIGAFRESEVSDATGARSLIWWRYQIDGRNLVNPLTQQLWFGINSLVGQPPAGLIALRIPCRGDCARARDTLQGFVSESGLR